MDAARGRRAVCRGHPAPRRAPAERRPTRAARDGPGHPGRMSELSTRRVHDAMAARVAAGELPGLVTVLARGDEVHVDAIGAYAFDGAVPMRRDTLFRVASFTKPILAAATLTLVEDGTLDLREPVDRLLPELADRRVLPRLDRPLPPTRPARPPDNLPGLLPLPQGLRTLTEPPLHPPLPA